MLRVSVQDLSCAPETGYGRRSASEIGWSVFAALYSRLGRRKLKWYMRDVRGKLLAERLKKRPAQFNSDGGYHIISAADRINGLARAYRYEIARLTSASDNLLACSAEAASNFLILGHPKDYRRLLASPPKGFLEGYRIGLLVTEFATPPSDWGFVFDILHEVWTPSTFSARALRQVTDLPVKVVPHAVEIPDVPPMKRSKFGIGDGQFLGMAIMDLSSCPERKNPLAHVRAWKLAFGNDCNAHLLMKVRYSKNTAFMRQELAKEIAGAENISVTEAVFSDLDMTAFQKMTDIYLSLHRAEGYGLNIHEMLEIGKAVITTAWSGNMDYVPFYPNAVPVPFELVPYRDSTYHFCREGLFWAEPDVEVAASALQDARRRWEEVGGSSRRGFVTGSDSGGHDCSGPHTNAHLPACSPDGIFGHHAPSQACQGPDAAGNALGH